MSNEFLDYVEDILDAMGKAEIMLEGVSFEEFATTFGLTLWWCERWKLWVKRPSGFQ
jgi:hypothetical protein